MSAVFPASIILVSNSLALFGSLGPFPLVTVCGKVSLLVTVTLSPFFTVIVSGSKFGLPCTEAPASIVSGFPGGPAVWFTAAGACAGAAPLPAVAFALVFALVFAFAFALAAVWLTAVGACAGAAPLPAVAFALVFAFAFALAFVSTTSFPVMYG